MKGRREWREGSYDDMSAADILGKVHKWGGGGLYIIFDLGLEANIAVPAKVILPAVSPHLTLYISFYSLCWNSYFGLQDEFKIDI